MNVKSVLLIVLLSIFPLPAQVENPDYTLTAEVGVGYSRFMNDLDYDKLNKNGFSGNVRFMWNPEHLLSIGIETGYQYLYSIRINNLDTEFGSTKFSASMIAVPIYIVNSMKITDRLKIFGGSGIFLLYNSGELFGDNLNSSQISIGFHAGVHYTEPISNNVSIGGQFKYSYISKIQDHALSFQFLLIYDLLRW